MKIEDNWTYQEALDVIKKLEEHGLEADISTGSIYIEGDPEIIKEICKKLELPEPFEGSSTLEERITHGLLVDKYGSDLRNFGR